MTVKVPSWASAVLVVLLAVIALSHADMSAWALAGALLTPVIATALLAAFPLVSLGICVPAALATAFALEHAVPPWAVAFGGSLAVLSALAGRRLDRAAPALTIFAAGTALVIVMAFVAPAVWATGLVSLAVVVVFPWGLGRAIRQQAELAAATTAQVHLRERTRIAHDMHDTLGHELSLLALRAGALEMAPDLDERHRTAIAELRTGAATATEVLSGIVRVLRDGEAAPLVADHIEDLVARAADAGMAVTLQWSGPRHLPPMIDRTAHRVVQEALTNAVKHAPGASVQVVVTVEDAATVVAVTNAAGSGQRRGAGGGQGLVALRERVRLAGGTVEAGPRDHGFGVVATLPHTS